MDWTLASMTERRVFMPFTAGLLRNRAVRIVFLLVLLACSTTPVARAMFRRPSIRTISRQAGSSAGGSKVVITGSGFQAGATVAFGVSPSKSSTVIDGTRMEVITPPHAPGLVNIVVTNPDHGTSTLKDSFEYMQAADTYYFNENFEDGSLGKVVGETDGVGNCQIPQVQTKFAATGTNAVRTGALNTGPCSTSRLTYGFCNAEGHDFHNVGVYPCNPAAANANGFYARFRIMLDQNAIDACKTNQCKLHLARYQPGEPCQPPSRLTNCPWDQTGLGPALGSNPTNNLATFPDSGLVNGLALTPPVPLLAGVWYEIEFHYIRNTTIHVGMYTMWVNGVKAISYRDVTIGSDDLAAKQTLQVGLVVNESPVAAFNIYIDDVAAADGWIE
jgi:hypothetical protein